MNDNNNTNNTGETPTDKGGVLSNAGKGILAKIPFKYKLIVGGIVAGAIASIFFIAIIISLFTLESVNSTEVAGSNRYDKNTTNAYEQEVIDYQEDNNITEYISKNDDESTVHDAYYNALFRAYEQYKETENTPKNLFQIIWDSLKGIFKPRSYVADVPFKDNSKRVTENKKFNMPYGVQIDTSLITMTLYSNRFYGDMVLDKETQEDKKTDEHVDFYLDASANKYYDLHSKNFRDIIESKYFAQARRDVKNENTNQDDALEKTKLAIQGMEILSKYMIQRVETYYTLNKEYDGLVDYDTTRHIKIVHKYIMPDECLDYIKEFDDIVSNVTLDHKRSTGGNYSWEIDAPDSCTVYDLNKYDDAIYDNPKSHADNGGFKGQYTTGYDELSYERDCEGYKEYLLGNYPTVDDKIMFCGGENECYGDHFIPAYYHNYVPTTGEDRPKKVEDIVYDIYSVLGFYENATMNYNVCSPNYTGGDSSIGDLSCGNVNPDFDLGDLDYIGDAYDIIIGVENKIDSPVTIDLCGSQEELLKKIADKALELYNNKRTLFTYTSPSDVTSRSNTYNGILNDDRKLATDCNGFVGYVINRALGYGPETATASRDSFTFFGPSGSSWNVRGRYTDLFVKVGSGLSLSAALQSAPVGSLIASNGHGSTHIQVYVGNGQVVDLASVRGITLRNTDNIRHSNGVFTIFVPNTNVC